MNPEVRTVYTWNSPFWGSPFKTILDVHFLNSREHSTAVNTRKHDRDARLGTGRCNEHKVVSEEQTTSEGWSTLGIQTGLGAA